MKNLLIVGGAGRNVGKTEFVCRLINKVSATTEVYALKVSAVFPDEQLFHGDHGGEETAEPLYEEVRTAGDKDTMRMLRAGARRVFYLRSDSAEIGRGFELFLAKIPEGATIVCESNSLADVVNPALLVMVKSAGGAVKPRAVAQLARADLVVVSDGQSGFPELARITIDDDGSWRLLG